MQSRCSLNTGMPIAPKLWSPTKFQLVLFDYLHPDPKDAVTGEHLSQVAGKLSASDLV